MWYKFCFRKNVRMFWQWCAEQFGRKGSTDDESCGWSIPAIIQEEVLRWKEGWEWKWSTGIGDVRYHKGWINRIQQLWWVSDFILLANMVCLLRAVLMLDISQEDPYTPQNKQTNKQEKKPSLWKWGTHNKSVDLGGSTYISKNTNQNIKYFCKENF